MKVITEAILRDELRANKPESYTIEEGKILSPAAREYLQQYKIKINVGTKPKKAIEKPEHMTHLYADMLVAKDHQRIVFRGKLDSLQAMVVLNQTQLVAAGEPHRMVEDLNDIVISLREIMRADVLDEPFHKEYLIGLTMAQLREQSHNPMKYYRVEPMILPDYSLGKTYALLNQLRTQVRETELAAVKAFHQDKGYERGDIIEMLNRMSSAIHIIICRYLAGMYNS